MLATVKAVRFDGQMKSGRTAPCKLECVRADASSVELVAKFSSGCDRKNGSLVAEAVAAMLAADLDLPVPEPFLVSFDADFIDCVPASSNAVAARMRASSPIAFGSAKLPPGFAVLPTGKAIPSAARQEAAEIFAFDCLIQNPDRRPTNPNLLFDGQHFAIFDHELAFMTQGIIGWRPPWVPGSLRNAGQHVLFGALQGKSADLRRLEGAWQAISDSRLDEYLTALPLEWNDAIGIGEGALGFVREVRDNIRPALAEVVRVLA